MTTRKNMTREQRQHHYQQWLQSGMNKVQYARQHGINIKTFGGLCAHFAQPTPAALLPAVITPATAPDASTGNTATLLLKRASITGSPQALAILIRELSLC